MEKLGSMIMKSVAAGTTGVPATVCDLQPKTVLRVSDMANPQMMLIDM
jgi:hypothetical protein